MCVNIFQPNQMIEFVPLKYGLAAANMILWAWNTSWTTSSRTSVSISLCFITNILWRTFIMIINSLIRKLFTNFWVYIYLKKIIMIWLDTAFHLPKRSKSIPRWIKPTLRWNTLHTGTGLLGRWRQPETMAQSPKIRANWIVVHSNLCVEKILDTTTFGSHRHWLMIKLSLLIFLLCLQFFSFRKQKQEGNCQQTTTWWHTSSSL